MPARLRPTAPIAHDAILVGDPGRALMLAQELLQEPKMSNHARGLWGYTGVTADGRDLTIQATGMGGPSAAVVLHDLAELGVRRAVRVGTATSLGDIGLGEILVVEEAQPLRGSFVPNRRTEEPRSPARPDRGLTERLRERLPAARAGTAVSLDRLHRHLPDRDLAADAADMQTAALLAAAAELGIVAAALLVIAEDGTGEVLAETTLEASAKRAAAAAAAVLSP